MMLFKRLTVLFLIVWIPVNGFCYTRIYLYSEAEINRENLLLSDICKMEGDNVDKISGTVILPGLYRDGVIDSQELYDFLSQALDNRLFIFGSGVKIKKNTVKKEAEVKKDILVAKGEMVDLSIRKNGIVIEMKGKALSSGYERDKIDFRLTTGKVVKGKIISLNKADIDL